MTTVADAAVRLVGDPAQLFRDAQTHGSKAGDMAGQAFGTGFGRLGAAAISGLLLGTAANLTVLDSAARRYAADVGADAAEMDRAKSIANEFFKTNTQGYAEILGSLAKLRTDQGLTLDQAKAVEQAYLDFSRVTGIDATNAVKLFDDVQDRWNLTAERGVQVMDQLVASNQKYGGSVAQRVADLNALAPALQALNLDTDQAIGLENALASAGLDASEVLRGLNTAVKNLKPGETLQGLIDEIVAIPDPTARAQKAMEIFGPRVGAAIALAFGPDKAQAIEDYIVTVGDAAGATKTAAETIDGSLPNQFQLALKGIQGELVDLIGPSGSIGELVVGLGGLAIAFDTTAARAVLGWTAILGPAAVLGISLVALKGAYDQQAEAGRKAAAAGGGGFDATASQAAEYTRQVSILDQALKSESITQAQHDAALRQLQADYADVLPKIQSYQTATAEGTATLNSETDALDRQTGALLSGTTAAGDNSFAKTELTGTALQAADAAETLRLRLLGEADAHNVAKAGADANVAALTAEAAWLDNVGYRATVAARNLLALANRQVATNDAVNARLKQLGEDPENAGKFGGVSVLPFEQTFAPDVPFIFPKTTKAVSDLARTTKIELTAAFKDAKTAADAIFDGIHQKALRAISDEHTQAYAIAERTAAEARYNLEKAKEALFAPVDAEQAAFDADQAAHQRSGMARQVADAARALRENTDPTQVRELVQQLRDAREALAAFDRQARINADRAAATAAAAALVNANIVDPVTGKTAIDVAEEGAKAKADAATAAATTAENTKAARDKKAFDTQFDLLAKELEATKSISKRKQILEEIQALYDKSGLTAADKAKTSGRLIALALADGMKAEVAAVEKGAETLVAAINKYIRTHSPAQAGPWHDDPPEAMGRRVARLLFGGIDAESNAYGGPAGLWAFDGGSHGAGGHAGAPASAAVVSLDSRHDVLVDLGPTFERLFGTGRFIRWADEELSKLPTR